MKKLKQNKRNKITILAMVVLLAIFSMMLPMNYTYASTSMSTIGEDLSTDVVNELNEIDFSGFSEIISEFNNSNTNLFSLENIKNKIYTIISGENAISYSSFFASLFSILIEMVVKYLPMLSLIIGIGILSNLLTGVKSNFSEKSTSNLIHIVCFLAVVILVVAMVNGLNTRVGASINSMVSQMNILFPILLTLMTALGATASVGVFQPIVAILSTYVADFFTYIILPMFLFSFVFSIISNLSDNVKLDKFSAFISSAFKWCVGIIFTLFFAVFTIQGISAGTFDSLSIRTTKYTIKSYVPVMGGYLSDGMDLIMSSTILIKNAVGVVGILLIITTIIVPILEIVVFSLIIKLMSAILQPLGSNKTSNFLMSTSKSITMLSTCLIAIGFMYLISIGLIMTTTNMVI